MLRLHIFTKLNVLVKFCGEAYIICLPYVCVSHGLPGWDVLQLPSPSLCSCFYLLGLLLSIITGTPSV